MTAPKDDCDRGCPGQPGRSCGNCRAAHRAISVRTSHPSAQNVWIYRNDNCSNIPGITKKERPLTTQHFAEFEERYGKDPDGRSDRQDLGDQGRFRKFHVSEIKERNYKLDITWLKDETLEDAKDLPEPDVLASEATTELEAVVDDLRDILLLIELNGEEGAEIGAD